MHKPDSGYVDVLLLTVLWLVNRDVMQLNIVVGQTQPEFGCARRM